MSTIRLEAQSRADVGKGASRRLRRLEKKVPAVIYGGEQPAQSLHLCQNVLTKALENETIYSSVFDLVVDGQKKAERVILKSLQRHPYKPVVLHLDFQRVSATDVLVKMVPIHFINEDQAPGLADGGVINHTMNQVEIRCEAQHLPPCIELDIGGMQLNDVLHLSNLPLPKGVELTVDLSDGAHDHPVISIHLGKVEVEEPVAEELVAEGEEGAAEEGAEGSAEEMKEDGEASEEQKPSDSE